MKLLTILLISFTASASYLPKSKIGFGTDGIKIHSKKENCETEYSESCISIRESGHYSYSTIIPLEYDEAFVEVCTSMEDCMVKASSLICAENYEATTEEERVLCLKNIPEHVGIDSVKKAEYDTAKTFEAIEAVAMKKLSCAVTVKAHVGALNLYQGKTQAEIQAIMVTYADVVKLLDAGALDTALVLITSMPVTAEITQEYKDSVIAKINSCNVNI